MSPLRHPAGRGFLLIPARGTRPETGLSSLLRKTTKRAERRVLALLRKREESKGDSSEFGTRKIKKERRNPGYSGLEHQLSAIGIARKSQKWAKVSKSDDSDRFARK